MSLRTPSRTHLALLAIFVIAIGVRVAYLTSDPHPRFGEWLWGGMAHNIVDDGHWFQINEHAYKFVANPFAPPPRVIRPHLIEPAGVDLSYADSHPLWRPEISEPVGESVVLAGLWEITGSERFLPDQILRIVLDALMALLVYRIAMRLFERRRAALLAAALYALYPPVAWQTISPYVDIWAVDATIAIAATYLEALHSPHRWCWLIACGTIAGVGGYFRPNVLVLPAVLGLITIPSAGRRRALGNALGASALAALALLPWTIRNYAVFHHRFIPTRGAGQVMWEGLGELHNDFGAVTNAVMVNAEVQRTHPGLGFETPAWDDVLKGWALKAIEHHPLFYLELLARRTAIATVWSYDHNWMHRDTLSPLSYKGGLASYVIEHPFDLLQTALQPALFLLAMLALGLTWRRYRAQNALLLAVVLATVLPYILIHVEFRYVLPAAFVYLIWIGLGADLLAERIKAPRALRRLAWGAPAIR
jgi:4-amino-4-deoxy-L-arabinose transferase-like glycosyltransferase